MKRATTFISMLALCVVLGACGRDNKQETAQGSSQVQEQSAATENSQAVENSQSTQNGDASLTTGEAAGTEGELDRSSEMEEIRKAVTDALGENYWPDTEIIPEMLEGTYGLTTDMYDDILAEMPMIGTNVDTLIVVKAKEGRAQDVEEALTAYREMMVNDTMQYPMNVGKIQASRIEVIDNYVCFVQLGADTMELSEKGDDAVIEHCLEQNELAIEVIRNTVVK